MLDVARRRGRTQVVCGDAMALPFADGLFDLRFCGLRPTQLPDLTTALGEIHRVTRPGGLTVTLDFFLPANRALAPDLISDIYTPGRFLGLLLHGVPACIRTFLIRYAVSFPIEDFSLLLRRMGYVRVEACPYIFRGIGLHWGVRR